MAGGPTTPALVAAARSAGALGFLAGGYKTPEQLAGELGEGSYGVNLFAPNPVPVDPAAYASYAERLRPLAERLGAPLPATPSDDDDAWEEKVALLAASPPALVSFTFGLPGPSADRLRRAGCLLAQTVTSADEARLADEAGMDVLVVQAPAAGGHAGTFTPATPVVPRPLPDLVREIRAAVDLPVIAGGGVASAADVRDALEAGAQLVAVGTLLLLADDAGTSPTYRSALEGPDRGEPVLTRAYSGRPARGLPTTFMATYDASAPLGYPAVHHLTSPLRRAAAAAGDADNVNLWAGTGYRAARRGGAAEILRSLLP
ncbi:MAG: nitronate monooxygenase [Nocardioidaceae bacterium]|nr:nitronate monooxygenase [Nocardioidaceae bacterium]